MKLLNSPTIYLNHRTLEQLEQEKQVPDSVRLFLSELLTTGRHSIDRSATASRLIDS